MWDNYARYEVPGREGEGVEEEGGGVPHSTKQN